MTRRCFLHVGSPKTGTTYLQSVLWASREDLRRQGLLLPLRLRDHFELTLLTREVLDPDTDGPEVAEVLERLREQIARTEEDLLISHELLAFSTPHGMAQVRDLLAGTEVHLLLTVRDWPRQLPAEWQQLVKTRYEQTYEHFLAAVRDDPRHGLWRSQDYARVTRRWREALDLPAERVHVVTVPPPGADPALLLTRFCSVLGVDPARVDTTTPQGNPSLSVESAELMRRVNGALGERLPKPRAGYARVAKFWFAEKVLGPAPGTRLALPAEHQEWCRAASRAQVDALAAAGYDVVGDLGDLLPDAPDSPWTPPRVDEADLLERSLDAIGDALVQRLEDLRTIDALRGELRRVRERASHQDADPPAAEPLGVPRRVAVRARRFAGRARRAAGRRLRRPRDGS